jgi:hypothetical protein
MADKGLSILVFSRIKVSAHLFPSSDLTMRNDLGVESNTDSIIEHKNEITMAKNKYINRSNIRFQL